MQKNEFPQWPKGVGSIPAVLPDGSSIMIPVYKGVNFLTIGTTGSGKTSSFTEPAARLLLNAEPRMKAAFFEVKKSFLDHFMESDDKVITHNPNAVLKDNLFVPSMDVLFISDIFRLVTDLRKVKAEVKWYYPETVSGLSPKNMLFETAQMKSNLYKSSTISGLTIEFKVANSLDESHRFYDFEVCDGAEYNYFTLYMDEAKLDSLMSTYSGKSAPAHIHLPYNKSFYGGLTGKECAQILGKKSCILTMNNFKCREEFIEATTCGEYGKPERLIS